MKIKISRIVELLVGELTKAVQKLKDGIESRVTPLERRMLILEEDRAALSKRVDDMAEKSTSMASVLKMSVDTKELRALLEEVSTTVSAANEKVIAEVEEKLTAVSEALRTEIRRCDELRTIVNERLSLPPVDAVIRDTVAALRLDDTARQKEVEAVVSRMLAPFATYEERITEVYRRCEALSDTIPAAAQIAVSEALSTVPLPKDGKDAEPIDPKVIEGMVKDAVAALPVPKDGKDAEPIDPKVIEAMVKDAVAALPAPKDGKDAEPIDPKVIEAMVKDAVAALPVPKDGKDAEPVDPKVIEGMVKDAVAALPVPKDGKDGKSFTIEDAEELVEKAIAAIPVPTAADVAASMKHYVAEWALDFERRAQDRFHEVIRNMPKPKDGKDGKDGIDIKMLRPELLPDGKTLRYTFKSGDETSVYDVVLPIFRWLGFYKEDATYLPGDALTFAGSVFLAVRETSDKPETSDAWKLVVKRGRDGKEGKRGETPTTEEIRKLVKSVIESMPPRDFDPIGRR